MNSMYMNTPGKRAVRSKLLLSSLAAYGLHHCLLAPFPFILAWEDK
jgi:hypothetical protein